MNSRNLLTIVLFVIVFVNSNAQTNLLNAKKPEQIGLKSPAQQVSDNDKPLEYGYVDDRDILMGKTIWEIIDLNERINFPLYFPVDTVAVGFDRRSLYDVLIKAIRSGKLTEVYTDSYFNTKKSFKDIQASLIKVDTTDAGRELINQFPDDYKTQVVKKNLVTKKANVVKTKKGKNNKKNKIKNEPIVVETVSESIPPKRVLSPEFVVKNEISSQDVTQYRIKGYWYFDSRQGELRYRLLGICPVTPDVFTMDKKEKDYIELFWVFFPAARNILHEAKAFNEKNSAIPISFDQILNSRRFNSVIYQEENVYNDRKIESYLKDNSQGQLLEAERIKEKIRNFESDLWNY